ncbi:MAG: phosphate acyltransferase PlsX [Clostridia bacterium]|nr:phosphate acyltransferase PlsX [Clostridia bacterium]MBR5750912.1 phosphate acyltransferase PlsX [Clostridia bacterium]
MLAADAMGGDNAPGCVIDGIKEFLADVPDADIRLFGPKAELENLLGADTLKSGRVQVVDAPDVITMHDEPMMAVRRKTASSLVMGLKDVAAQNAQAFVSAGSTGALFLGGMVTLRMLPGISRPALAAVLPGLNAPFMLLDCGANADCQPEYLKQFGLMGSVYMDRVMNVKEPKVGLVNIGAEEEKGSKLYKEAHQLMKAQKVYTFCGNVEARDIQLGDAQVVVADGFTGNVILKYAEGLSSALFKMIKTEIMSTTRGKLGGLMLKPAFSSVKTRMNKDEYGGAPLLGVNGCVVKAHGSSNAYAFRKALEQAVKMVRNDLVGTLRKGLEQINQTTEE